MELTKDQKLLKLELDEKSITYIDEDLSENLTDDSSVIEYEILSPVVKTDERKQLINQGVSEIDAQLSLINNKVDELNSQIDSLTNHADGLDYAAAVISGIIAGIIDSVFVGEWNFEEAKAKANKTVNNQVIAFVKKDPRYIPWCENISHNRKRRDPERLNSAIEFLEEHYKLPGDGAYKTGNFGINGSNHRLDDFCHHPTLIGMLCCIIVQFTGSTIYSHNSGEILNIPIGINNHGNFVGNNPLTKVMAGFINWFISCAKAITNQKGHLMSDVATSAGLPGPFLSTLKEISALPCFRDTMFSENLRKAYQNGIGTGKNQIDLGVFNKLFEGASGKLDKRTEIAIGYELKRQAIPVIINEALVRGFYFVRRFIQEMKQKKTISEINWKNVLPFKNRTIVRMLTIATGTFTAFDVIDAAIRSGGFNAQCILRINFVGVGRFAVAIGTDAAMGIKKHKKERKVNEALNEYLHLLNVKTYYINADLMCSYAALYEANSNMHSTEKELWIEVEKTQKAMNDLYVQMQKTCAVYFRAISKMNQCMEDIEKMIPCIEEKNPGLREKMLERLK